jgi:hypothetical protein
MTDRRFVPWMAGLIALAVATLGVATWVLWWGSDLLFQVDRFYRTSNGSESIEVSSFYDRIGSNAFAMTNVASPLLAGTVVAVFGIIAVLALRWQRQHR